MYDYLFGTISEKSPSRLTLDVGGVGYELLCPLSTTTAVTLQSKVRIWVKLVVREDSLRLFGFASETERRLFNLLQEVQGVGPSLALVLLSGAAPAEIVAAIRQSRTDILTRLKGVGPKTALRLVTELRDRVDRLDIDGGQEVVAERKAADLESDAVMALEVLGCPSKAARAAVTKVLDRSPGIELDLLVKQALKIVWPN